MALAHPDVTAPTPHVADWLAPRPAVDPPDDPLAVVPVAPFSWAKDSDDRLADENDRLRRELARLRRSFAGQLAENERLRAERDAGLVELHAAMIGALLNPHLKIEAAVLVRALMELDRRFLANPTADGWVRVPLEAIGSPTFAEEGEPAPPSLRHRTTVAKHLQRGAEWGLIEHKVIFEDVEEKVDDPKTGKTRRRRRKNKATLLRRDDDLVAMLRRLAEFVRPEKSNHGGPRPCRWCRATARTTVVTCDGCGARLVGPAPDLSYGSGGPHAKSCGNNTGAPPEHGEDRENAVGCRAAAAGMAVETTTSGTGGATPPASTDPPPPPRGPWATVPQVGNHVPSPALLQQDAAWGRAAGRANGGERTAAEPPTREDATTDGTAAGTAAGSHGAPQLAAARPLVPPVLGVGRLAGTRE